MIRPNSEHFYRNLKFQEWGVSTKERRLPKFFVQKCVVSNQITLIFSNQNLKDDKEKLKSIINSRCYEQ